MKKLILFFAATILLAVSCSKTLEVVSTSDNGTAIGFGTWTDVLTRARAQGASEFSADDTFSVYGFKYKTTGAVTTTEFTGTTVTYGTPTWTYTPIHFWDNNYDTYTFYGVSPASVSLATAPATTGLFVSDAITFAGNDNDVLVANETLVEKTAGTPAKFVSPVNVTFNHIASLLDLKVRKAHELADATVAITSISLANVDNVGTFTVASYNGSTGVPAVNWAATGRTSYTNTSGVTSVATLPTNVVDWGNPAVSTNGDYLINHLVVMPQTFRTDSNIQTVTIEYTITVGTNDPIAQSVTFNLAEFDTVDDTDNEDALIAGFEQGKFYTFYITINADAITFTASITDWTTANGYHYIVK